MCCTKCGKMMGAVLLIVGVLYLLQGMGTIGFWNVDWWTIAFLLGGLCVLGCASCGECQTCCGTCETPKKKKK